MQPRAQRLVLIQYDHNAQTFRLIYEIESILRPSDDIRMAFSSAFRASIIAKVLRLFDPRF